MTQTIAQQISRLFGDDGQRFEADDGRDIGDVCEEKSARTDRERRGYAGCATRYEFEDGSAIVTRDGGWDIGIPHCAACYCWEGADHGRHVPQCIYSPDCEIEF